MPALDGGMKPFEIFRTGKHTSSQGATLAFAEMDLAAIASSYDPALHQAPIVVGHPKQDGPAYGWVKSLAVSGDRLVCLPEQVNPEFAELVKAGSFKKVSAAFYQPASPNNPTPGSYHLRHVGFLGAEAPAVKGLKPVEFSEGDDLATVEIEFSEWRNSWAFENIARMFRGIRDWMIEKHDVETADRVVPIWDVEQLTQAAVESRVEARAEDSGRLNYSETPPQDDPMTKTLEELKAELDARENALKQKETTFSENARKARATEDAAFVAGIVQDGRLPIGLQATATALFSEMGDDELTFSEGDQEVKTSGRAAFRNLLSKIPKPVSEREIATGDGPDFSDPEHVAAAITTEIQAAKEKGEDIGHATALARLKARR